MITRALAQNLAVIGMLATLQEVRRIGYRCNCGYDCNCADRCDDEAEDAMIALGERQWGEDRSSTHKEIYG